MRPRWLVLNKIDLLLPEDREQVCKDIVNELQWDGPRYRISAVSGEGTKQLMYDIMEYLEAKREAEAADESEA
jgi:GTP-binding protein